MQSSNSALVGTVGGTFLSVLPNLSSEDLLRTIFLAAVGAVVSFSISVLFKFLIRKRRK